MSEQQIEQQEQVKYPGVTTPELIGYLDHLESEGRSAEEIRIEYNCMCQLQQILDVINSQPGHNQLTLAYLADKFRMLMDFKVLFPIKDLDEEWIDVTSAFPELEELGEVLLQNRRLPSVFKHNGFAYNINAKVGQLEDGRLVPFSAEFPYPFDERIHQAVTFPFYPSYPEIVKV
jgi:hypothetical protein